MGGLLDVDGQVEDPAQGGDLSRPDMSSKPGCALVDQVDDPARGGDISRSRSAVPTTQDQMCDINIIEDSSTIAEYERVRPKQRKSRQSGGAPVPAMVAPVLAETAVENRFSELVEEEIEGAAAPQAEAAAPAAPTGGDEEEALPVCEECPSAIKLLPDPGRPTRSEIVEHYLTHLPFRPWCKHCVVG